MFGGTRPKRPQRWGISVLLAVLAASISVAQDSLASTASQEAMLSYSAAARFLEQATWGPTPGEIRNLQRTGLEGWFESQRKAATSQFPLPRSLNFHGYAAGILIQNALNGPDQLRQRMAFTLGQIWVVSGLMLPGPVPIVTFEQVLHNHALSNY